MLDINQLVQGALSRVRPMSVEYRLWNIYSANISTGANCEKLQLERNLLGTFMGTLPSMRARSVTQVVDLMAGDTVDSSIYIVDVLSLNMPIGRHNILQLDGQETLYMPVLEYTEAAVGHNVKLEIKVI